MADLAGALVVRPWSHDDTEAVAGWRYAGAWAVYNLREDADRLEPANGYRAVVSAVDGDLVGFYCVGREARVPGIAPRDNVIDVGVGMNPALIGRGHGYGFVSAVLADIRRDRPGAPIRAVIQTWNQRSLRLARRLGFVAAGPHRCIQDGRVVDYTVLVQLPAQPGEAP